MLHWFSFHFNLKEVRESWCIYFEMEYSNIDTSVYPAGPIRDYPLIEEQYCFHHYSIKTFTCCLMNCGNWQVKNIGFLCCVRLHFSSNCVMTTEDNRSQSLFSPLTAMNGYDCQLWVSWQLASWWFTTFIWSFFFSISGIRMLHVWEIKSSGKLLAFPCVLIDCFLWIYWPLFNHDKWSNGIYSSWETKISVLPAAVLNIFQLSL